MPKRARVSFQIATIRLMSASRAPSIGGDFSLPSRSMDISLRVKKPACISAETLAVARASTSCGQSAHSACRSAINSRMARLSQITSHSVLSAGAFPEGEWQDRGLRLGLPKPNALLRERDAALLEREPGAQTPRGEILVADHERVAVRRHASSFRHCLGPAPLPLMRPAIKSGLKILQR